MTGTRTATRLTANDYYAMPDDGKRYELIDGELYEMPSPSPLHQDILLNLALLLRSDVGTSGGKVYVAPLDVYLSTHRVVQPDVLVLLAERTGLVTRRGVEGAPNLVIEVLSPSNTQHDRERKLRLYAEAGVPEVWYVSPEMELIEVLVLHDGRYEVHTRAGRDEPVTSVVLPGLSFPASAAFQS